MKSFWDYWQEYKINEDAVMAAGSVGAEAGAGEVTSPNSPAATPANLDISPPKASNAMTDNSVLGKSDDCDKDNCGGFFGRNDFRIPYNVLSGNVEIPKETKPKVLKRF